MTAIDYKNIACIVGVGQSPYALQVNRSPVSLQAEAFRNALADAGLEKGQIDGFNTAHGAPTGVDYDEFVAHAGLDIRGRYSTRTTDAGVRPRSLPPHSL